MKQNAFAGRALKVAGFALVCAGIITFTGCFYMPGLGGRGVARARIVVSRALSPNIASVALVVTGPGMDTITQQYGAGTTTATLAIPSGVARNFTLLVNSPSATLQGTATVDLAPGETKDIVLTPTLVATQIIVPDFTNDHLVQVADMKGTGWTALFNSDSSFYPPYDVDFDDQGRIYFASYDAVYRIDDISDPNTPVVIASRTDAFMRSIAMDRKNGMLYYTDGTSLYRKQVTPTLGTEELVDLSGLVVSDTSVAMYLVTGIAVDSDGFVYIANNNQSAPASTILKINPNPADGPAVVAYYSTLNNPWDVLVNGDYIYVSDFGARQIVRLSKDLGLVDSFSGPKPDTDPSQEFVGPERFVAILNKPITLIDEEADFGGNIDRLVSFNDMTGAGWTIYGSSGTGQDQFQFYNTYAY